MLEPLLVIYRGDPFALTPVTRDGEHGYSMNCPKCGTRNALILHPTEGHAVWKDERGELQIRPSLVCGNDCGWHVIVENGEARDV
jgi:hypothetical protein